MSGRRPEPRDASGSEPTRPLEDDRAALALLVLGPGVTVEVALHGRTTWTLGRARDNDVVLDHPSVSRRHARLHAHGGFALEALAATNPLRFGGRQLGAGERAAIAPGEAFALGALVGVIRPAAERPAPVAVVPPGAIVVDPAMVRLYEVIARIAPSNVPVLIEGETGAGKEVVAHALHLGSPRASGPFVRINCGALPATLVESELFGHERGAFTGADRAAPGLLASAHGGSVFFDEIGELPLALQATLLRVLEDGAVRPVGATRAHAIDVRWIAATNRDLAAEVERGAFRKDLYYRLQGFVLAVPALRERRAEVRAIARALAERDPGGPRVLDEGVLAALERYAWPGNVRELRNAIASAVLLAGDAAIELGHLPPAITRGVDAASNAMRAAAAGEPRAAAAAEGHGIEPAVRAAAPPPRRAGEAIPGDAPDDRAHVAERTRVAPSDAAPRSLRDALADEERRRIVDALRQSSGNQSRAAELLGMPRRTLVKRVRDYGIARGRIVPDE